MAMCLTVSPFGASAATKYLRGDVTGNGEVDIRDVTAANQYLMGMVGADGATCERLDVNRDYIIDENDVNEIRKINIGVGTSGLIDSEDTSMSTTQADKKYIIYDGQTAKPKGSYTLKAVNNLSASTVPSRMIVDDDDRDIDYSNTGIVILSSGGTGVVVGRHTILTAAHCVYNVSNVKCDIYKSGVNEPSLTCDAVECHISANYKSGSGAIEDYALITVAKDLKDYLNFELGVCRDDATIKNPDIFVTGLSGDHSEKEELDGKIVTGKGKFKKNGIDQIIIPKVIHYSTDTIGGTSGAPVYVKTSGHSIVIGIHSDPDYVGQCNYGKRVDTEVLHFVYNNPYLQIQ